MATRNSMGLPRGRAPMRGEGPDLVRAARTAKLDPDRDRRPPGEEIVARRHPDWKLNEIRWRWLLDSFEGGARYRDAVYGMSREGPPLRNLVRHKREYPDPTEFPATSQGLGMYAGSAAPAGMSATIGPYPGQLGAFPSATANDDQYEYRRARTVPPNFVDEVVSIHLGKIYDQEVSRRGPDEVTAWWANCTGGGLAIAEWMRETVAPLLLVLGQLDVVFDRPALPAWVKLEIRDDEIVHGQDRVVAAYILPENMLWWDRYPSGEYRECLVREYWSPNLDDDPGADDPSNDADAASMGEVPGQPMRHTVRYRHWTQDTVALYDGDGEIVEAPRPHGYPGVPIIRLIDRLAHRTPAVGKSRYEFVAGCMQDYYNRDSELILSDTLQACPMLSGPEEVCKSDSTLSVGPGNVLPMMKVGVNGEGYQGWEYVSPPKEPAESIRKSLDQIRERVDRDACLMKPAGVTGTTGGTVSQSGYSKAMDAESGNKKLSDIARSLARAERLLAEFSLACTLRRAPTDAERRAISITYPARFQLKQGQDILNELTTLTQVVAIQMMAAEGDPSGAAPGAGTPADQVGGNPPKAAPGKPGAMGSSVRFLLPTLLAEMATMYARAVLPGRDGQLYRQIESEAKAFYHLQLLPDPGIASDREAMAGRGTEEEAAGEDPTGVSASTAVSATIVNVT